MTIIRWERKGKTWTEKENHSRLEPIDRWYGLQACTILEISWLNRFGYTEFLVFWHFLCKKKNRNDLPPKKIVYWVKIFSSHFYLWPLTRIWVDQTVSNFDRFAWLLPIDNAQSAKCIILWRCQSWELHSILETKDSDEPTSACTSKSEMHSR